MPSLVNEWLYLSSARFLLVKTVQYSSQRRGTPNLHLLSHPLTLRRCNLSNESNCIVCRDAPLEFLNLPWCPSPVTGIAVVPSLTQTFPRQELQCPMTNEIRPLRVQDEQTNSELIRHSSLNAPSPFHAGCTKNIREENLLYTITIDYKANKTRRLQRHHCYSLFVVLINTSI